MSNEHIKEIYSIAFGILSPEEIANMSVCQVENTKLSGCGSVYDERMGRGIDSNLPCVSCKKQPKNCVGHFGHIELNEDIIHPLYYKNVVSFLRTICLECNRILITEEQIYLLGINIYKRERKFKKILEKCEKTDICCHCNHPHPKVSFNITDNIISLSYKDNSLHSEEKTSDKKISIELSVQDIKRYLNNISDEDVILMGFDPSRIHPRNMIMSVFPVIPPCSRPCVMAEGHICDDDLTNQLLEIIKSNNTLNSDNTDTIKYKKALQSLKFRILTFYNNSKGKAKHPTNGRPIKGIKERLTGKEGQIRNNLMGKRVEFSGRTVIGPDPRLNFGEMGIPLEISKELTIPERVTSFNKNYLLDIVNNGKANFVDKASTTTRINLKYASLRKGTVLMFGDIVIRKGREILVTNRNIILREGDIIKRNEVIISPLKNTDKVFRNGEEIPNNDKLMIRRSDVIERNGKQIPYTSLLLYPTKKRIYLDIGDTVHRHLRSGDIVLLNRQPTLHKGSMLAKKIKVMPGKTFRMNLATTKTFNADFDGDEMNIHVPQSIEARAELKLLSATKYNIISAQGSKPNIAIVQDSLLASYIMTNNKDSITKSQFCDISMYGTINGNPLYSSERINIIKSVLRKFGKSENVYNGRGLISLILPEDFIYEKRNNASEDEPIVKIYRGVLYEGIFDKSILGASYNSLIQVIHKEYGVDTASEFISNIQFITNQWLLVNGFSVGLGDCLITSQKSIEKIQDKISRCYIEANGIRETTHNKNIREIRITASLSKAKDVGMKIAKKSMSSDNNLLSTVHSGSKGDFFNIAQLTGLLGQQNILGKRVKQMINNGKRTLPHYPFGEIENELEYESRGFIRHSFIEGLNPCEYFFHAMSGREGVCDTAMGTAKSGYIQRRIIKVCEDIQIQYDGTVCDTTGNTYQMVYGNTGIDPCKTLKVGASQQPCNISRMVDKLNLQFEINTEEKTNNTDKTPTQITNSSKTKIVYNSRLDLLKQLHKLTGLKKLYKGLSDNELVYKLEQLSL